MSERLKSLLRGFKPILRKAGRPSKLDAVMMDRICVLRADGHSWSEISKLVKVHRSVLVDWRRENPGFYHMTENAFRRFQKRELLEHGVHRVTA